MADRKEILLSETIIDIAAGPFGSNLPKSCFIESGFPIIDGANLKEFKVSDNITKFVSEEKARSLYRSVAKKGDVVVTISGTVGQISYIPESSKYAEYLVSQRQFRCTFDSTIIHVPYIVYYFHSHEGRNKILQFANQVGVPALSQPLKNFRNIRLPLPPLSEQKKIAAILSSLDEKIETNRKINARLEELAQAIFKSWFIDFEPFGGKMPEDWEEDSIYRYVDVIYGAPYKSELFNNDGYGLPLIRIRDLKTNNPQVFTTEILPNSESINPGDIVVGMDAEFEPYIWFGEKGLLNQRVCKFKSKCSKVGNLFILYLTQSKLRFVQSYKVGTTVSHLGKSDIDRFRFIYPPLDVVEKFTKISEPILKRRIDLNKESSRLAALRDTLLPKLMSGELLPE